MSCWGLVCFKNIEDKLIKIMAHMCGIAAIACCIYTCCASLQSNEKIDKTKGKINFLIL